MNFFVSPPTITDLKIELTQLAATLKSQWQKVEICLMENSRIKYSLEWIIFRESRNLEGALEETRQAVILDGDVADCANFSLWLRSFIELKYPLFFYDEGYSADIELQ